MIAIFSVNFYFSLDGYFTVNDDLHEDYSEDV